MPLFGLVWMTSCVSCVLASTQAWLQVPDYLSHTKSSKILSAVSIPVESFYPSVAQNQLYAAANRFQNSHATASLLDFNFSKETHQTSSKSAKIAHSTPTWIGAIENALCRPAIKQTNDPVPAVISQSTAYIAAPSKEKSGTSIPHKIAHLIQNLFKWADWGGDKANDSSSAVAVVRTRYQSQSGKNQGSEQAKAQRNFWLFSQRKNNSVATQSQESKDWFQIWVKGRLIAQIPDKHQADLIAQKIARILQKDRLNASDLQPTLVEGEPGGQLREHLLFVINDAIAGNLKGNRELLAIEWVNNLRVALGESPLTIAAAQRQMYGLVETEEKIEGLASWYGDYFHGRLTANGEKYSQNELTAAHPSLPFNTYLQVTNKENGNSVIVRINDRGPYVPPRKLDLSRVAARCIESEKTGIAPVEAIVMQPRFAQSQAKAASARLSQL